MLPPLRSGQQIVLLGTHLDTRGGVSAVISRYRDGGLLERTRSVYIATHRDGNAWEKTATALSAWFRFVHLLVRGRVALAHVHTASRSSWWRKTLFLVPALLFRVPTILHLHGGGFRTFYGIECGRLARKIIRLIFDRVDRIVVLSASWEEWVRSITRNPQVRIIPNPVDIPAVIDPDSREPATLLFLGKLCREKGSYDLLRAAKVVSQRHPDLKLLLGGDGDREGVSKEARALGLESHVQLLGWIGAEEKSQLLRRATVYVLPSYAEGLPMSVLEAMAAGVPVISTPVGGIPETVTDGEDGFLVRPGDIAGLADALDNLLADPERRRRMGRSARNKTALRFASDQILRSVEQLYGELTA